MRNPLLALLATWLLLTIASCDERKVYDHYVHTSLTGWNKGDTLSFSLPKIEKEGVFGMDLRLRTNNSYPFTGLTLIVQKTFYPSMFKSPDTIHCKLRDDNGTPRKQGISYYQYSFHVTDLHLRQGDSLQVEVRHNMKRETLPGISDVGIMLTRY